MNTFKRHIGILLLAFVALMLGACASTEKARIASIQDTNDRIERVRKAESAADTAIAESIKVIAATDPHSAALVAQSALLARAMRGGSGGAGQQFVVPERARDFLDYVDAGTRLLGAVATVAVPIVTVKEAGKTQRAGYERDVSLEQARQGGESNRFGAAMGSMERLGTAAANADRGAHTTTTITAGGDVANNNSSIARITCEAAGGQWNPTVPASTGTTTSPPSLSGSAGAGTCTQR